MKTPEIIKGMYKKPFRYDGMYCQILDKDDDPVLDVHSLRQNGIIIPDKYEERKVLGQFLCDLLNENYE